MYPSAILNVSKKNLKIKNHFVGLKSHFDGLKVNIFSIHPSLDTHDTPKRMKLFVVTFADAKSLFPEF
jgi:hypothetical protein